MTTRQQRSVSILTGVAPHLADYLEETAASVREARGLLHDQGWDVTWVLSVDGPGLSQYPDADIIIVSEKPGGVSAARNYGLGFVQSAWVYSLDGDDVVVGEGLCSLLGDPQLDELDWVVGSHQPFGEGAEECLRLDDDVVAQGTFSAHQGGPRFNPNNLLARTNALLLCGGWPATRVNEDMGLLRALSRGGTGALSHHLVAMNRQWPGQTTSLSNTIDNLLARQFQAALERAWREREGLSPARVRVVEAAIAGKKQHLIVAFENYDLFVE